MKHGKHGLKALGLSFLLALSMTAISAVSAQAAEWLELVGGVSKKVETNLPFVGEADSTHWLLHSEVAGVKILILCTNLAVTEGVLKADGTALAKLSFSTCATFLNGEATETAKCAPKEPLVMTVIAEQFLHNNRDYLYLSPDNGTEIFTTFELTKNGNECAIGEKFNIKGHMVFEDCENKFREHLVRHLIKMNESLGTTLFPAAHTNGLKFGANAALILGSEWIKLATGNSWAGNAL